MMDDHDITVAANLIRITIDRDKLRATAILAEEIPSFAPELVGEALATMGVVFGIQQSSFSSVGEKPGIPVVVAEGVPSTQGCAGWIELLVQENKPRASKESDNTRTTFKVTNVLKGATVARVHDPASGTDGTTVTGESIPGRRGILAPVHPGHGVAPDVSMPGLFVATCDGNAVVEPGGKIAVQETIDIKESLDMTMGDIDFVGSLIIHGDIHGDIAVKVGKNLIVMGDVDDAVIEAGGDVQIKNGFMGRGNGSITAGGSVRVQHVRNQHITAGSEVYIERESVNGIIAAKRKIIAPRAVIAGGTLEADELVDVGVLGRVEGGQVKVRVGRRGKILDRLAAIEKEMRQLEKNLTDVKDAVYRLVRLKIDAGSLPPDRESILIKLQETQRQIPQIQQSLSAEQKTLSEELQRVSDAKLVVHETVSDNVFIDVNGAKKLTDDVVTGVVYLERNGELTATGM